MIKLLPMIGDREVQRFIQLGLVSTHLGAIRCDFYDLFSLVEKMGMA